MPLQLVRAKSFRAPDRMMRRRSKLKPDTRRYAAAPALESDRFLSVAAVRSIVDAVYTTTMTTSHRR